MLQNMIELVISTLCDLSTQLSVQTSVAARTQLQSAVRHLVVVPRYIR